MVEYLRGAGGGTAGGAKLDALIHGMSDAVYVGDERGVSACNEAALLMLGCKHISELEGGLSVLFEKLRHRSPETGEHVPRTEEPLSRALEGETVIEEIVARHHQTGEDVLLRCAASPMREEGSIVGAIVVNTDLTDSRWSENLARSTLDSLSTHIAILDETGRISATNRAWHRFASSNPPITSSVGPGTNYLEVCDAATGKEAEDARAFARGIRDVISGRLEAFELEYPCHSPDKKRWFVGRVTRLPDTVRPQVVVAHEDVTERRLAEEEARLRAGQQEAVAGLGRKALAEPDLQVLLDETVGLVARTLGVEYCRTLELLPSGDEMLLRAGIGWEEGLVGNATEKTGTGSQAGYTLLSNGPVILEDLAHETRFDRSPLLLRHSVVSGMSAVVGGERGPFGVIGAHTMKQRIFTEDDVNFLQAVANVLGEAIEWRRAEEGMREVREAERRRMARDLHDGPLQDLTYALTAAQLAQSMTDDSNLGRWLERAVEAMKRTGQELRTAVYDLRLEVESDRPLPEQVRSLVELNRRMSPDRHIRLSVAEDLPPHPLGRKDPELLRILQEALANTRRHSEAENVSVSLGVEEGRFWAEVEDDGRGFEAGTSSGIGLKSMHERARALGGALRIESEPGRGTRVRFTVARGRGPQGRMSILLVEDHTSFRDAATAVFQLEPGFEVVGHAGSLAEARQMIDNGTPVADVAIIDLGLPDGYGGDLIKELHSKNLQTQVLVVSGSLDRAEVARAVEAGAAGVLHKSVGMGEVIDAVRRIGAGEMLMPLEEVVDLLRLAGHQREEDREARRAVARLTPREIEVLRVLAEGLDGKEIAERLGISAKTGRNHVASIMEKLGVHSRLQALVFAIKHGVVDPPRRHSQRF
ncbi:MAG TPA: LuxR C-terminal-related transcriptional regulator [Rubrobacter sp.]|nr:LuxR C-terminal-related transcriptional regulator [Rubrobacter sp.]